MELVQECKAEHFPCGKLIPPSVYSFQCTYPNISKLWEEVEEDGIVFLQLNDRFVFHEHKELSGHSAHLKNWSSSTREQGDYFSQMSLHGLLQTGIFSKHFEVQLRMGLKVKENLTACKVGDKKREGMILKNRNNKSTHDSI